MWFNAYVELNRKNIDLGKLLDALDGFHPAIGDSPRGWTSARISLQAETLKQATVLALTLVADAGGAEPIHCEVQIEDEFTARRGFIPVPELVGATEAAELIGVSRQRVQQLASNGDLPSTRSVARRSCSRWRQSWTTPRCTSARWPRFTPAPRPMATTKAS